MNINKLKGLLKERGYTYVEFVSLAGISLTALQNCLKKGKTDTETLKKICEVLEVSSSTILNF
jgi:DNA-binding Xre family transcriptional regulator